MWIQKVERFTIDGRVYLGHSKRDGAHLLWRQHNQEKAKANSRLQASKTRERMRAEWSEYCTAYLQRFPGTVPVGFDRWSRTLRRAWVERGPDSLLINHAKGMRERIDIDHLNRQGGAV
jgi:hypothetical protein